jgi:hypothetical protein
VEIRCDPGHTDFPRESCTTPAATADRACLDPRKVDRIYAMRDGVNWSPARSTAGATRLRPAIDPLKASPHASGKSLVVPLPAVDDRDQRF